MSIPFVFRSLSLSVRTKNPSFSFATLAVTNPVEKYWTCIQIKDPNMERALTIRRVVAKLDLDPSCVEELITRCSSTEKHRTSGLRFFIWAGIQRDCRHNSYMYNIACKAFKINQNPNAIKDVIESYTINHSVVNLRTFKVVLNLCKEAKLADEGLWVLKKMKDFKIKPDIPAYNIVIRLFCEKSKFHEALKLMKEMSLINLHPGKVTFQTMLNGFCDLGRIQDARKLFKIVNKQGRSPDFYAYSTLLDGVCKHGDLEKAFEVLLEMENRLEITPTVFTYTSMIRHFCERKRSTEALTILDKMEKSGRAPNGVITTTLINGLVMENKLDQVYKLIDRVVTKGCVLKSECYSSLVAALFKVGKFEDGERVFRRMFADGLMPDGEVFRVAFKKMCLNEERVLDCYELLCNKINILRVHIWNDKEIYPILTDGLCKKGCFVEASKLAMLMGENYIKLEGRCLESVVGYFKNAGEMELASRILKVSCG
ncbi:hypothetical protein L2E82_16940 [Cichorium intybus]|uniref:Uncharacterized protein n=1 Tax=Cichorium intybus TaxID=13427 RepID=A0ACB9F7K7_CICIN|nr:hypothetical protein L2E82_16940 [Cichorium intybus]